MARPPRRPPRAGSGGALSLQPDSSNAVEVYGLQKVFSPGCCGGKGCCGACWCVCVGCSRGSPAPRMPLIVGRLARGHPACLPARPPPPFFRHSPPSLTALAPPQLLLLQAARAEARRRVLGDQGQLVCHRAQPGVLPAGAQRRRQDHHHQLPHRCDTAVAVTCRDRCCCCLLAGAWGRLASVWYPTAAGRAALPAGVLPPSGGDALVYGESLSTPGGMDRIRCVCVGGGGRGGGAWHIGIKNEKPGSKPGAAAVLRQHGRSLAPRLQRGLPAPPGPSPCSCRPPAGP